MRPWFFAALLLAGCHNSPLPEEDLRPAAEQTTVPLSPGTMPVRIGEQGPSFAACGIGGEVIAPSIPVRAAPFEEASVTDALEKGRPLFVCTRSIDQRWLGVVVPPAAAPQEGCGVTSPVGGRRAYEGACLSGWIPAAAVRARAR
ncbi:hypothetical protein [Sphingomonas desiccabilis]|uniref:Integron n=1 Tax=Sphingomonas desiccabilis TaxID=429134 RepID=A0A4Q2IYQ8_9SPHN|nr:hypothetical protein [Sphingomonas desiccabilis]MBB3909779.1 hypothetical protein [Sphingomonas desiccabilis]RXZ34463.1 hypothetical protein EO081_01895 [Sphingomonas desiccabilis]